MKKIIKQGTLVEAHGEFRQDILLDQGKVQQIAAQITPSQDCEVIDATGMYVLPGGIDVHTHFNIDVGIARSCDDFFTGTRAAACGGTTTIIDHMGFGPKGCSLYHQLEAYHGYARGKAAIDYSFHGVVQHIDDAILDEMHAMVAEEGISSFKLYMTYGFKLQDADLFRALQQLYAVGALTTIHPENDAAINALRAQLIAANETAPIAHARSRPLECEAEAIARILNLAKLAGNVPLYIVHLSNGLGLDYIRLAKRAGQPVWVETCPHYLLLDSNCYLREDGIKYILSPPLRSHPELDKLWVGIADGTIDTVATDHCTFPYQQRRVMSGGSFINCPNGLPGVENRMPLLFSSAVMTGRISVSRFVELTSTRPAKLFGLWPQKGNLQPGADADIVIMDPNRQVVVQHQYLHDNCDYSPYEGFVSQGWPVMTLSRGEIVAVEGKFRGKAGHGQFIHRKPFMAPCE